MYSFSSKKHENYLFSYDFTILGSKSLFFRLFRRLFIDFNVSGAWALTPRCDSGRGFGVILIVGAARHSLAKECFPRPARKTSLRACFAQAPGAAGSGRETRRARTAVRARV